jgi:transcriptional regulator with XRE-family HTH domain
MSARTVKLRLAEFDTLTIGRGWRNDKERAEGLGISQSQMSRIRSGESNPGAMFVDRCLEVFGPLAYDRLFERVEDAA